MNVKAIKYKKSKRDLRKARVRSTVIGTEARPRLSVHISNMHVTAQLIDDSADKTLAYATTIGVKKLDGSLLTKSEWIGSEIAKKAKEKKIKQVVFDRNGRIYHGRVAALADAARKEGLEF